MLLQAIFVIFPDVFNGENGSVVRVVRVRFAVTLVCINVCQSLREFFFCVFDAPEQFIVKMQDSGALPVRRAAVIGRDSPAFSLRYPASSAPRH